MILGPLTPQFEHHVRVFMGGESHVGKALDSGQVSRCWSDWCDVKGFSGLEDKMTGTAGERRRLFLPSLYWLCHPWAVGSF